MHGFTAQRRRPAGPQREKSATCTGLPGLGEPKSVALHVDKNKFTGWFALT